MDSPSEDWHYNDQDDFNTAITNIKGEYNLEIYAQLRLTELILDPFGAVLGGSRHLEINTSFMDMIPNDRFRGRHYRSQKSRSDVIIRKYVLLA
jgi:hypothetical protein